MLQINLFIEFNFHQNPNGLLMKVVKTSYKNSQFKSKTQYREKQLFL